MNTTRLINSGKVAVTDHLLPVLGGILSGQVLGKYRLIAGLAVAVYGVHSSNSMLTTGGAVCALTPLAAVSSGTAGFDDMDALDGTADMFKVGQARIKSFTNGFQQALWPFGKPKSNAPGSTAGLGNVYADYDNVALAGNDDDMQLIGNLGDFSQDTADTGSEALAGHNSY